MSEIILYYSFNNDHLLFKCQKWCRIIVSIIIFYCSLYFLGLCKGCKVVLKRQNLSAHSLVWYCFHTFLLVLCYPFFSSLTVRYHPHNSIIVSFIQSIHCVILLFIFHFIEFTLRILLKLLFMLLYYSCFTYFISEITVHTIHISITIHWILIIVIIYKI